MSAVAILSIGAGDTTLTFDKKNPVDRERAAAVVTQLLKSGYALLVQVGKKGGEPIFQRARTFDPKTCEYIIAGGPDEAVDIGVEKHGQGQAVKKAPAKRKGRRTSDVRLAADNTAAYAVHRSAGG